MILGMVDEILSRFDKYKCTFMSFLDLSAAFNIIDIDKMVEVLAVEFVLSRKLLQ